jgi:hypothetical protein
MIGTLYRYPHPHDPTRFIYVGQGPNRDKSHRLGSTSFGRRFKEIFPDDILPEPIKEKVEVFDQFDLNDLETIWMFRFHTWKGYPDGMNLTFPGFIDYKEIGSYQTREGRVLGNSKIPHEARVLGGKRVYELHPEFRKEVGSKSGKILFATGRGLFGMTREARLKASSDGGKIGGRIAVESGHLARIKTKETSQKGQQMGGDKSRHVRWHINRGIIKLGCVFCISNEDKDGTQSVNS